MGPYRSGRATTPARKLELGLRARVVLNRPSVMLATLLLLVASMAAWHVAGWSSLLRPTLGSGPHARAEATVESVEPRSDTWVVRFVFRTPDGRTVRGVSFAGLDRAGIAPGDHHEVEYDPTHPDRARIPGLAEVRYQGRDFLSLAWPLGFAAALLVIGLRAGSEQLRMLRLGRLVQARFVGTERSPEGTSWLRYEHVGADGTVHTARTRPSAVTPAKGSAEHLLLHPSDEGLGCALAELPRGVHVVDGRVRGSWPAWLAVCGMAALAIHVVGALLGRMPPMEPFL